MYWIIVIDDDISFLKTAGGYLYDGPLHDVGKIGIPRAVINKPARLTEEEYALIKEHPVMGYRMREI